MSKPTAHIDMEWIAWAIKGAKVHRLAPFWFCLQDQVYSMRRRREQGQRAEIPARSGVMHGGHPWIEVG